MTAAASRRAFLRATTGLAAAAARPFGPHFAVPLAAGLAGLGSLAAQQARAANTTDGYKALVCLFMHGGNDSHNWVVPTDTTNYASYAAARGELAVPQGRLLPLTSSSQGAGRSFGMPLELAPLRDEYEAGRLAIVANVGTLVRPLSKAEYQAGTGAPTKLFSHNDQQAMWQSMQAEGAATGWGGRFGDILMSANQQPVFTAVSASGNAVFLSGSNVTQYQVNASGPVLVSGVQAGWRAGSSNTPAALQNVLAHAGSNNFTAEYVRVVQRSLATASTLQTAFAGTSVTALPATAVTLPNGSSLVLKNDGLAKQLRVVAQMIAAAPGLGMRRQVFMVSIGGFDTHSNQSRDQPLLMSRVAHSVQWFMQALQAQGLHDKVMLFSASDFGRTLASNGDGCDHGWGSHHFVAGGAVRGREIHGRFPVTALGTADDVGSGRLLPSTGVTQLAASLGGWMGLGAAEVAQVLPNATSFSALPLTV